MNGMSTFHRATYNLVAKKLREQFPTDVDNTHDIKILRGQICELALDFASSFCRDNPAFDPIIFLDACSPNVDRFPMSELWKVHTNGN